MNLEIERIIINCFSVASQKLGNEEHRSGFLIESEIEANSLENSQLNESS
jgi:hypothetical protein